MLSPLVEIGLTDLQKNGMGVASPAPLPPGFVSPEFRTQIPATLND